MNDTPNKCCKMAGLIFEGALDNLNEAHMRFVKEVLTKRGIINGKVVAEPVGKKGDNYVASVLRLAAESNNGDRLKMVAKIAPQHPVVRGIWEFPKIFGNEHTVYDEVLPKLTEQEEISNVPKSERFKFTTFYGSNLEEPNEIILLEDLKESNFVMLDKTKSLSNDSVKLVIKDLARLHSLSYVMKHKNSAMYNNLIQKLTNLWLFTYKDKNSKRFYWQLEKDILTIMDNEEHKALIKNSVSITPKLAAQFHEFDLESEYSVIQHGDCWTNNIMFRLENDRPVECIMIDYQLSKVASPAQDILYFILCCTDYEIRSKHFCEWIDYYHTTLVDYLTYFDLDASFIYPRCQLDADLKKHGRWGLGISLMVGSMSVRDSKDAFDSNHEDLLSGDIDGTVEKGRLIHLNKETLSRFKTKAEGLVNSLVEVGLITE